MSMLTVIGEGLVDVVQRASGIEAHVGGSPLNVAVGLARLDHPVQFIGRYGRDAYGDSVAAHLRASSVMLPLGSDELPTSVATALIDDDGAATYTFDLTWELPGIADRLAFMLQGTTLLHTGSIATMLAPGATDVLAAVEYAHPRATISFDPNCRPSIITDVDYARRHAEKVCVPGRRGQGLGRGPGLAVSGARTCWNRRGVNGWTLGRTERPCYGGGHARSSRTVGHSPGLR
jgi:fructokinase